MATPKRILWLTPLIYFLFLAAGWYALLHYMGAPRPMQISYSDFLSKVRSGEVSTVRIEDRQFVATLKPGSAKTGSAKSGNPQVIAVERLPGMDETSLLKDMEAQHVQFSGHISGSSWWA